MLCEVPLIKKRSSYLSRGWSEKEKNLRMLSPLIICPVFFFLLLPGAEWAVQTGASRDESSAEWDPQGLTEFAWHICEEMFMLRCFKYSMWPNICGHDNIICLWLFWNYTNFLPAPWIMSNWAHLRIQQLIVWRIHSEWGGNPFNWHIFWCVTVLLSFFIHWLYTTDFLCTVLSGLTLHAGTTQHLKQTDYFPQVRTCLTRTISWSVQHVWKSNSRQCRDLILWFRPSQVSCHSTPHGWS